MPARYQEGPAASPAAGAGVPKSGRQVQRQLPRQVKAVVPPPERGGGGACVPCGSCAGLPEAQPERTYRVMPRNAPSSGSVVEAPVLCMAWQMDGE